MLYCIDKRATWLKTVKSHLYVANPRHMCDAAELISDKDDL